MGDYLRSQLTVMMFGGLAGPIMIGVDVILAKAWSDVLTSPSFYIGLLITGAAIWFALWLAGAGKNAEAKEERLQQHGVPALAQITGVIATESTIRNRPVVEVHLHVSGSGLASFDAQESVAADITRQRNLDARKLVVLVDPAT